MRTRSKASLGALLAVAVFTVGCGGDGDSGVAAGDDPFEEATAEDGDEDGEVTDASTMPDVVGMPVDEATAQLEELGFTVSTGVVRTTEMEPDLVYRSEPAAGRQVREGQRVTLRVAAEPRE